MNFRQEFKCHVIDYFVEEYMQGRTPNPCIACNRYVKWEALLDRSLAIGADYIATGHYASSTFPSASTKSPGPGTRPGAWPSMKPA